MQLKHEGVHGAQPELDHINSLVQLLKTSWEKNLLTLQTNFS